MSLKYVLLRISALRNGGARDVSIFVVSEEGIDLDGLSEVLYGLQAADSIEEIEVALGVDAGFEIFVLVNIQEFDVGVVLLEGELEHLVEFDVGTLDSVYALASHLELVEVEGFGDSCKTFLFIMN